MPFQVISIVFNWSPGWTFLERWCIGECHTQHRWSCHSSEVTKFQGSIRIQVSAYSEILIVFIYISLFFSDWYWRNFWPKTNEESPPQLHQVWKNCMLALNHSNKIKELPTKKYLLHTYCMLAVTLTYLWLDKCAGTASSHILFKSYLVPFYKCAIITTHYYGYL